MRIGIAILFTLTGIFSQNAFSDGDLYGVVAGGYGKTDFETNDVDHGAYKFGIGYQFDRQWYAEFGYQQLANQSLVDTLPTTSLGLEETEFGLKANAIYAAVLGKAGSRTGELFYRLGVMNIDVEGQHLSDTGQCDFGDTRMFSVDGDAQMAVCEYDEGVFGGVIGIGFDFYLGVNVMLRTEVEHITGENGLKHNAGYIGLRYNF